MLEFKEWDFSLKVTICCSRVLKTMPSFILQLNYYLISLRGINTFLSDNRDADQLLLGVISSFHGETILPFPFYLV